MKLIAALLLAAFALAPQDPAALIELLRSDDFKTRERACAELEKLGAAAEEALKKAAKDSDAGLATIARYLLRILETDRKFSPALKKAYPGLAKRLVDGPDRLWADIYLEVWWGGRRFPEIKHPELTREDLEPLATPALEFASDEEYEDEDRDGTERGDVLQAVAAWQHRSARGEVRALRGGPNAQAAFYTQIALAPPSELPALLKSVESDREVLLTAMTMIERPGIDLVPIILDSVVREDRLLSFATGLRDRRVRDLAETLLKHADSTVRKAALTLVAEYVTVEDRPLLNSFLADTSGPVRAVAAQAILDGGFKLASGDAERLSSDSDAGVRVVAARWAGRERSAAHLPWLRKLVADPSSTVRFWAVKALQTIPDPACVELAAQALLDKEELVIAEALKVLGKTRDGAHVEAVAKLLDHEEHPVYSAAARALRSMGWKPGLDRLISLVGSKSGEAAELALELLIDADPARARAESVRMALSNRGSSVDAIHLMMRMSDPGPLLIRAVETPDSWASDSATRFLSQLRSPDTEGVLRKRLDETEGLPRARLLRALSRLAPTSARPDFVRFLKDPSEVVRAEALEALGRTPPGDEGPAMIEATLDESEFVRAEALRAMRRWKIEAPLDYLRLLKDPDVGVNRQAAWALCDLDDRSVFSTLHTWLLCPGSESEVRYASDLGPDRARIAVETLTVWGPGDWKAVIVRLLNHRDAAVRVRAARLLGRWKSVESAPSLIPLLKDPATARSAIRALAMMSATSVLPDLAKIVDNPAAEGRGAAFEAMLELEFPSDPARLRRLATDPDPDIQARAIERLGWTNDPKNIPIYRAALDSPLGRVRTDAVKAMGRTELSATEEIEKLLEDCDPEVSGAAESWILDSDGPTARKLILRQLEEGKPIPEWWIAKHNFKEAIPFLKRRLAHPDEHWTAASALRRLGDGEAWDKIRARKDLSPDERWWLIQGDGHPAADVAAYLDKVAHPYYRAGTAAGLCHEGIRAAAPTMIRDFEFDEEIMPHSLNGVRSLDLWQKLLDTRFSGTSMRSAFGMMEEIARLAGMKLEWPDGATFEERLWRRMEFEPLNEMPDRLPAIFLLPEIFKPGTSYEPKTDFARAWDADACPWDFILEPDRIRVVPRREAFEFWKRWWAAESSKDKK